MITFDKKSITHITFITAFLFQIACAIQGFDLTDEGFLMNAYNWIGEDPNACKDAGGYTLSCLIGWFLNNIYKDGGILMMRLWGVLLVFFSGILVYSLLHKLINSYLLLIGIFIEIVTIAGIPKPFDYNTLTAFIYISSLALTFYGFNNKKSSLLFLAGILAGTSVLMRLPNILFIGVVITPYLYDWEFSKRNLIHSIIILTGWGIGLFSSWLLLAHYGIDKLVLDYIQFSSNTLEGESSHNLQTILSSYSANYVESFKSICYLFLCVFVVSWGIDSKSFTKKILCLSLSFITIYRYIYIGANIEGKEIFALTNGIGCVGCIYLILKVKELRYIALCGLITSILAVLGSDRGFVTTRTGTWILFPVGMHGVYTFLKHSNILIKLTSKQDYSIHISSKGKVLSKAFAICMVFFAIPAIVKTDRKAYYDPDSRAKKTYVINNKYTKNIFTIKERADIVNPLLEELNKYVKPGDYILQYDFSPLIYYMTQTKPFNGVSWPCVLYGPRYIMEFKNAEKSMKKPPLIVAQHFYTQNKWQEVVPNYYNPQYSTQYICHEHTKVFLEFVKKYHYHTIWTNKYFHIMISSPECINKNNCKFNEI